MAKELERAGLPTSHVCSIVPISRTVGANRIVPSVAIPHPLGDPARPPEEDAPQPGKGDELQGGERRALRVAYRGKD